MDWGLKANERLDTMAEVSQPATTHGSGMDFCEEDPSYVFRTGIINSPDNGQSTAAVSYDYGRSFELVKWQSDQRIIDCAVSAVKQENGYPILMAVTVSGKRGVYRSLDNGETWEFMSGAPVAKTSAWYFTSRVIASDRVDGKTFYYTENSNFYVTVDGGANWVLAHSFPKSGADAFIRAIPGVEGGVWYRAKDNVYASYDRGMTWEELPGLTKPVAFGFGIGKKETDIPASYFLGYANGEYGLFISDDLGKNWRRINDNANGFPCGLYDVTGDRMRYGRVFIATGGRGVFYGQPISLDDEGPIITVDNQSSADVVGPEYAVNDKIINITGSVNEISEVKINSVSVELDGYNKFSYSAELQEGENEFLIEARDANGNFAEPVALKIRYIPDFLGVEYDTNQNITTNKQTVTIKGRTAVPATVHAGDKTVRTDKNNRFEIEYGVSTDTQIPVYAVDDRGICSETTCFNVTYDKIAPEIKLDTLPETHNRRFCVLRGSLNEPGEVRVNGKAAAVKDDLTFFAAVQLETGDNDIRIQARDTAHNASEPQVFSVNRPEDSEVDTSVLQCRRAGKTIDINGDVSDFKLTNYADKIMFGSPNNEVTFDTMWDDEYLYFGVNVIDDIIYNKHSTPHENDAIEIYVDGDNAKKGTYDANDKQMIYAVDFDLYHPDYAFSRTSDGYSAVIRIPWSDFGVTPQPGVKIGFDIDVVDNDDLFADHQRSGAVGFNGTSNDWKDTSGFATITLTE